MTERRHSTLATERSSSENGTRTGEQIINRDGFLQFWAVYPRRVGRLAAIRAWNKARPDSALLAEILRAVGSQQRTDQWRRGYIPNPATWINQGRWEDETGQEARESAVASYLNWKCPHDPRCASQRVCDVVSARLW